MKILIVEDERLLAFGLKKFLENLGHEITEILGEGEAVSESIEKEMPDAVLMDIRLEGKIDGIHAVEAMKSKWNIPVVYMTAHTDEETVSRARKTNPHSFLEKPIDDFKLKEVLKSLLG